ncbi:TonB-dependent siderophore receptor [Brucella intermedia]|uniref:TonB-dependent siderophore receptor n=1 Tax=Brucella intermedia TaxID=94625 RepID=UPI00224B0472|nr:TonB-dependent receptor [Brucella intermedia]
MGDVRKQKQSRCGFRHLGKAILKPSAAIFLATGLTKGLVGPVYGQESKIQQAATDMEFNIRAQALGPALTTYADRAGLRLLLPSSVVEGKRSPGLIGNYTREQGLARLLAGTGLNSRFTNGNTVTIVEPQSTGVPSSDDSTVLETIVVQGQGAVTEGTGSYTADWMKTANGLALPQRKTPQSTSVITRQLIEDRGMTALRDVMENATGVTVNQTETDRLSFYSRGFQIDSYQYDGVPTTLDSTYQYGDGTLDTVIYDHIEVVRGATGLMQNTGEPGASVNFIRKRPTSEFKGYISGLAGTESNYRTELDVGGPLNKEGTVRGRIVGALQTRKDTIDLYKQEKNVIYGVVEADITDATTVTIGGNRQETDSTGTTWAGLPAFDSTGKLIDWPKGSTTGTPWSGWNTIATEGFISLDHTFENDWKARFAFNHSRNDFHAPLIIMEGNPDPVTGLGVTGFTTLYDGDRRQNSLSGSLNGEFDAFERTHEFVAGVFASRTSGRVVERKQVGKEHEVGNIFEWSGDYPEPVWKEEPNNVRDTETRQLGIYGAARLSLTDRLSFIGGARLNYWDGKLESYWENYDYKHSGIVTPYAGITYDLTDQYTLYASYTNIFKPQTYQDASGNYLDPAYGHNYEVGIKGSLLDGRVNASFAVFQTDQKDVAEYVTWDTEHQRAVYRSIDGTTTRGFEIEVAGEVYDGLNLFAGYTYRDAQDDDGNAVNTFQPRGSLKLGATYRFPDMLDKLTVGGSMRWQSKTKNLADYLEASQSIEQDSYAVFDAMLRYDFDEKTSLNLNVYNIADKRYFRTMGFYNSVFYGEGRTATLSLKREF